MSSNTVVKKNKEVAQQRIKNGSRTTYYCNKIFRFNEEVNMEKDFKRIFVGAAIVFFVLGLILAVTANIAFVAFSILFPAIFLFAAKMVGKPVTDDYM